MNWKIQLGNLLLHLRLRLYWLGCISMLFREFSVGLDHLFCWRHRSSVIKLHVRRTNLKLFEMFTKAFSATSSKVSRKRYFMCCTMIGNFSVVHVQKLLDDVCAEAWSRCVRDLLCSNNSAVLLTRFCCNCVSCCSLVFAALDCQFLNGLFRDNCYVLPVPYLLCLLAFVTLNEVKYANETYNER